MRFSYTTGYHVDLPQGHRFPMSKYALVRALLESEGLLRAADVVEPQEADWGDVARVHTAAYIDDLQNGTLAPAAVRRLGFPWSPALLRRSRLAVQGTLNMARAALRDGCAANLAGGTHHAFADRGEGFCVLNDVAIAIQSLRADGLVQRAVVIDLDVHQGNGTAHIFREDPDVFTFSMHGARNYPFHKEQSTLDVPLPDGTDDEAYLTQLHAHLSQVLTAARADIAFYLSGVDVAAGDRFGRLALTPEGVLQRDLCVLRMLRERGIPVVLTLAGGYAPTPHQTAHLHAMSHRAAAEVFG